MNLLVVVSAQLFFLFYAPTAQRFFDVALRIFGAHHESDTPARVFMGQSLLVTTNAGGRRLTCRDARLSVFGNRKDFSTVLLELCN
jgi:hypothetical protein